MMKPRVAVGQIIAPSRGIMASVECQTDLGTRRTPISARSQAANDAHALAIIQWHTSDKLLYEAITPQEMR